jgi:hypothetical protein
MIDEDSSHDSGGDTDEVGPVSPLHAGPIDHMDIGLIDQGGGLEGVTGTLASHES